MPALHPSLFSDYRQAKRSAAAFAAAIPGCTLLQNAKGKPRVVIGNRTQDFPTWLSCASWLHQIRADAVKAEAARRERERQKAYMDSLPVAEFV